MTDANHQGAIIPSPGEGQARYRARVRALTDGPLLELLRAWSRRPANLAELLERHRPC